MAECTKVSVLSNKSLKLLSRLNDSLKIHDIPEASNSITQNVESKIFKTQITWLFKRNGLDIFGTEKRIKSLPASVNFLNTSKLWLEMYSRKECWELTIVDLFVCFDDVPENMYASCDVSILNNNKHILWEETFYGKACDMEGNKIKFVLLNPPLEDKSKNIFVQCRIKLISNTYKCTGDKQTYIVKETSHLDTDIQMRDILEDGKYSDFILKVGSQSLKSHKCILALKSPSFRILFKLNCGNIHELKYEEYDTIKDMLKFLYTENIEIRSFQHAWKLFICAHKYEVLNLKDLCSAYLDANLTEKNVSHILDLSRENEDEILLEACLAFIKQHDLKILTKSFLNKK